MRTINQPMLAVFTALSLALGAGADTITVKGSDTIVVLAQRWAEAYMRAHPDVKIQVTGGGSGTGLAALQNQSTDLAMSSRKIRPREIAHCLKAFGRPPTEYAVCLDGLSVYAHRDNPVASLTLEQLAGVFTGRIANWRELGGPDRPINVYGRENSSGTYFFFKERVLKGRDFGARTQAMPGTAAVLQAVVKDAQGIGYGGFAYGVGAKILKLHVPGAATAVAPSQASVRNQSYPLWRYCYFYVNPQRDQGEVARFLKWIRGADGQRIVTQVGYFPLPATSPN